MIRISVGLWLLMTLLLQPSWAQVDTAYIYKTGMPYGTLDIRIAKSATRYCYLEEGKTFSFRERNGAKTNTYADMTSWDSSPYTQGNLREKNGTSDAFIMNYRLLPPSNYNASYSPGYPLIIMMHGVGERGNCWDGNCFWADESWRPATNTPAAPTSSTHALLNNDLNLLQGGSVHLQARNAAGSRLPNDPSLPAWSFPGFILYPQNLNGWDSNSVQDAIRLLRLIMKRYKVDPNRVYIHGLSDGGGGVYDMLKRAPWLFAAALPMSAITDAGINAYGLAPAVANVPLWIFQGGIDTNPTPGKTEGYIKKFREAGFSIRYTKYDNLGHGVWNTAYAEPDFFSWMRSKSKSDIHVFADIPVACQSNGQGARLELAEGFLAYQWEYNGAIISGATGAQYAASRAGTYRARFSRKSKTPTEAEWNEWSKPVTVGISNPVQAQVTQTGTVLLKDLNYYNNAILTSTNPADRYFWYKDGALINLTGDRDDTTRTAILKAGDCSGPACAGNGIYTLVTSAFDNCPSPPSAPVHIYFSDQAPTNIAAPTGFVADGAATQTTASMKWTDASPDEDNFEIWRRKVTDPASKWQMATITPRNITSFQDSGLDPGSTYQYKIRAVSSAGRSPYTPSASNQFLTIVTAGDTQIPTTPQNLAATTIGIGKIRLTWQASSDNTGIASYTIYYGSTTVNTSAPVTTYVLTGLPVNTNYSFTVKAVDKGGNLSGSSNAATANTYVTGLYYEHSTGAYTDIDAIDWSIAEFTGKVNNFTLAPRTQEDYITFEFDGYLYINRRGTYQFRVTSDDGSRLTLNNNVIIDNDGVHTVKTVTSNSITLSTGGQLLNLKYFDYMDSQSLTVQYRGPDTNNSWVTIPDSALKSGNSQGSNASLLALAASEGEELATEISTLSDISAYPNPLSPGENVSVKIDTPVDTPVHVKLMDFVGYSVYENTFSSEELLEGHKLLSDRTLSKGIYILQVTHRNKTIQKRIVVKD